MRTLTGILVAVLALAGSSVAAENPWVLDGNIPAGAFRDMLVHGGSLYIASGNKLYRRSGAGAWQEAAPITHGIGSPFSMVSHSGELFVVAGTENVGYNRHVVKRLVGSELVLEWDPAVTHDKGYWDNPTFSVLNGNLYVMLRAGFDGKAKMFKRTGAGEWTLAYTGGIDEYGNYFQLLGSTSVHHWNRRYFESGSNVVSSVTTTGGRTGELICEAGGEVWTAAGSILKKAVDGDAWSEVPGPVGFSMRRLFAHEGAVYGIGQQTMAPKHYYLFKRNGASWDQLEDVTASTAAGVGAHDRILVHDNKVWIQGFVPIQTNSPPCPLYYRPLP